MKGTEEAAEVKEKDKETEENTNGVEATQGWCKGGTVSVRGLWFDGKADSYCHGNAMVGGGDKSNKQGPSNVSNVLHFSEEWWEAYDDDDNDDDEGEEKQWSCRNDLCGQILSLFAEHLT